MPVLRTDDTVVYVCNVCMREYKMHADHSDRSRETSTPDPSTTDRRVRRRVVCFGVRSGGCSADISRSVTAAVGHVGVNTHVALRGEGCTSVPGPFRKF